jgi:DNA replication protein DnaC
MELPNPLTPMLRPLRLSGILETLEVRNRQAVEPQASCGAFLTTRLHDEVERRAQAKLRLRLRRAAFDPTQTLEGFDFRFNPTLNRAPIFDLATCAFIERHENVWIDGPTGVGKSHLAQALAHQAAAAALRSSSSTPPRCSPIGPAGAPTGRPSSGSRATRDRTCSGSMTSV